MKRNIYSILLAGLVLLVSLSSCKRELTGSLTGTIIDSQTGYGMSNVKISLTDDMTVTSGDDAEYSTFTLSDGTFLISDVKVGTYRMIVETNGYFPRIVSDIVISEGENYAPQQTIVEAPESGSFRVILIWGESPYDLDSHLTGPDGLGSRFHVYYSTDYNTDYSVDLDVDDTYSYGPETITIHSFKNGIYTYSVHNYSDQTETGGQGIFSSPAIVEIYDASGLVESFIAPAFSGIGNTWRVFNINVSGSSVAIEPVNTYVVAASSGDMEVFKSTQKPSMDITGF